MIVIVNPGAGTALGEAGGIVDRIMEAFADAGLSARILIPDGNNDVATLSRQAAASAEEIVVGAGGDGTMSAVATAIAGSTKRLGVLPLGTLNHFAKDLRIPLELKAAVQTIATGSECLVDVAEVNGRVFINNFRRHAKQGWKRE